MDRNLNAGPDAGKTEVRARATLLHATKGNLTMGTVKLFDGWYLVAKTAHLDNCNSTAK